MKWNRFTVKTKTEAEDIVISTLAEVGIEGVEIGSKKVLYRYKIDKVTKTSYGYYYRIYLGKGCYGGWRLYLKDKSTLVAMGNGNPYSTSGYSGTDSLVRHK